MSGETTNNDNEATLGELSEFDESTDEQQNTEDVMHFVLGFGSGKSDLGLDRRRPNVLEVSQIWGNMLVDSKHFLPRSQPVTVGSSVGWRWNLLGKDMAWVSSPLHIVLPYCPPLWSEVNSDWRNDFYASETDLPGQADHEIVAWKGNKFVASIASTWGGTIEKDGVEHSFAEAIKEGLATQSGDIIAVTLTDGIRVIADIKGVVFVIQMVPAGKAIITKMAEDIDYPFLAILMVMFALGGLFGVLMFTAPNYARNEMVEIPDRFVELLIERPQEKPPEKKQVNPDAGEGAKAKKEEGKVGKKDAKMEKAKGSKVEIRKQELDRQVAENSGVLGALRDGAELDGVFGSNLNADIAGGIGGLIGAKGTQIGSGGLGSRGSGLGGGGTAEGLGGLGTKGIGSGASGYGSGGGNFGSKGEGAITAVGGDPVILGALDKALIDEVVKRHMNQIKYCYQRELTKTPNLAGKVRVKFVIAKDGSVSSAKINQSTMKNSGVENCIAGRFLRMQFPKPKGGGIVLVTYPFIFGT